MWSSSRTCSSRRLVHGTAEQAHRGAGALHQVDRQLGGARCQPARQPQALGDREQPAAPLQQVRSRSAPLEACATAAALPPLDAAFAFAVVSRRSSSQADGEPPRRRSEQGAAPLHKQGATHQGGRVPLSGPLPTAASHELLSHNSSLPSPLAAAPGPEQGAPKKEKRGVRFRRNSNLVQAAPALPSHEQTQPAPSGQPLGEGRELVDSDAARAHASAGSAGAGQAAAAPRTRLAVAVHAHDLSSVQRAPSAAPDAFTSADSTSEAEGGGHTSGSGSPFKARAGALSRAGRSTGGCRSLYACGDATRPCRCPRTQSRRARRGRRLARRPCRPSRLRACGPRPPQTPRACTAPEPSSARCVVRWAWCFSPGMPACALETPSTHAGCL